MPLRMLIPNNPSSNLHQATQRPEPPDVTVIEVPYVDDTDQAPVSLQNGRTRILNAAVDPTVQ